MSYKFGKKPPRIDSRTIPLKKILRIKVLPPLPESYDVDQELNGLADNRMFDNSKYGDCVIAGRAHMTLRFEKYEQNKLINITDQEVINEYFQESGGVDSGLYMLNSLNAWRLGWTAADETYNIYAYASTTIRDHNEIKYAIYLLRGAYAGILVPQSAIIQFETGQTWDVVPDDGGILGGHAIYIMQYDSEGLTCMTWAKKQKMTWAFLDRYCDESYAVVDDRNNFADPDDPVDVEALDQILKDITGNNPTSSSCPVARIWAGTYNVVAGLVGAKTRLKATIP
jgi:hypothetical protein